MKACSMANSPSPGSLAEFHAVIRAERRREAEAVRAFTAAAASGCVEALFDAIGELELTGTWRQALVAVSRLQAVPPATRDTFLVIWKDHGDHIRSEANDDAALIAGLRRLLPPYTGGPMVLYRGCSAWNRRRRTYGMSWTASREVAEGFAEGMWRIFQGGSVVLAVEAPPDSIICALALLDNSYGEDEYLVDRRRLRNVRVLRRLAQEPLVARLTVGRAYETEAQAFREAVEVMRPMPPSGPSAPASWRPAAAARRGCDPACPGSCRACSAALRSCDPCRSSAPRSGC